MATNGGIIGKSNNASFGKCTVTTVTSTGNTSFQTGTRLVNATIVGGGGSGGSAYAGGGGGAGGFRNLTCISVSGNVPVEIGAGGAAVSGAATFGNKGGNTKITVGSTEYISTGGGRAGGPCGAAAGNGGSGGGGGQRNNSPGGSGNEGGFTPPEGNPGGRSKIPAPGEAGGGGGVYVCIVYVCIRK